MGAATEEKLRYETRHSLNFLWKFYNDAENTKLCMSLRRRICIILHFRAQQLTAQHKMNEYSFFVNQDFKLLINQANVEYKAEEHISYPYLWLLCLLVLGIVSIALIASIVKIRILSRRMRRGISISFISLSVSIITTTATIPLVWIHLSLNQYNIMNLPYRTG